MRAMTEIEWLDGRVTKVPELRLGDALGESVQAELDFGFDDVWRAFGLRCAIMSRMRTRTATRAGGAAHCTRTAGTAWSNRRTSTVSSASFTRGSRGSSRVAGELVNLSRACALSCLMLGSPYPPGALEALAACARYLCGPAFTSDLAARVRARIPSGLTRLNMELSPNDDPHPIGLHDDASMSQLAQSFRYSRLSRTDFFSSLS